MIYDRNDINAAVARALRRDPPQPGNETRTAEKYARMAQDFRADAWRHIQENDLPQASGKAWAMVAETIKAIGAHHGGIIHSHGSIWLMLRELAQLAGAAGDTATQEWISNAFRTARALHSNYYENEEMAAEVASGIRLCEQLSDRLYQLFWSPGAAA